MGEIRTVLDYLDRGMMIKMSFCQAAYGHGADWILPYIDAIRSELVLLGSDPDVVRCVAENFVDMVGGNTALPVLDDPDDQ